jgi:hypothetical protein
MQILKLRLNVVFVLVFPPGPQEQRQVSKDPQAYREGHQDANVHVQVLLAKEKNPLNIHYSIQVFFP